VEIQPVIIWTCTIGDLDIDPAHLPANADRPMAVAVANAFSDVVGSDHEFNFCGWGRAYLPEPELAVVQFRDPAPEYHKAWQDARDILNGLDDDTDEPRFTAAVSAVAELLYHQRSRP
jgi:hypothetical protein